MYFIKYEIPTANENLKFKCKIQMFTTLTNVVD